MKQIKPNDTFTPQKLIAIVDQMNKNLPLGVTIEFTEGFIEEFRAVKRDRQNMGADYFDVQSVEIIAAYLNMMLMYATCPSDGCGNSIRIYRSELETAVSAAGNEELSEFYQPIFSHWNKNHCLDKNAANNG